MLDCQVALLTSIEMSEAGRLTVASGISSVALMENAGRPVATEIMRRWSPRPVPVPCGPGSNGGDGFVAVRRLAEADWPVRVALLGLRESLRGAAAHHAALWPEPVEPPTPVSLDGAELVVNAIFGAGPSRALDGAAAQTPARVAAERLTIVAVDVPSGLMGGAGASIGAVQAVLTGTCFRKKPGHLLRPGRSLCGELVVAEIGTPESVVETVKPTTFENDPVLWASELPVPGAAGDKYTRGHALVWGGWPATGAARRAARSAARIGSGMTTVASPEVALAVHTVALTRFMVSPIGRAGDLDRLLIGPGAGTGADTCDRVPAVLKTRKATGLAADALSAFEDNPPARFRAIVVPCVLTPHEGEFVRLFHPDAVDRRSAKLARAREAAHISGAIVVPKGSDTVVAAPDGRAIAKANAPPHARHGGRGRCARRHGAGLADPGNGSVPRGGSRRLAARYGGGPVRCRPDRRRLVGTPASRVSSVWAAGNSRAPSHRRSKEFHMRNTLHDPVREYDAPVEDKAEVTNDGTPSRRMAEQEMPRFASPAVDRTNQLRRPILSLSASESQKRHERQARGASPR
jgi:hydroxyethylthiazole kinase-like uncharacterized protein yjeF